jgi:hypothetical protein
MISTSCASVAAVRPVNVILGRERERHAHRGRFLPDRQVRRPRMVVGHAFVAALGLDFVEHRFELADGAHVAPDGEEILARENGQLLADGLAVRIHRYAGEFDGLAGEDFFGLDDDGLRHAAIANLPLRSCA